MNKFLAIVVAVCCSAFIFCAWHTNPADMILAKALLTAGLACASAIIIRLAWNE